MVCRSCREVAGPQGTSYGGFGGRHPHFPCMLLNSQIRRSGHIVRDRPSLVLRWAKFQILPQPAAFGQGPLVRSGQGRHAPRLGVLGVAELEGDHDL
jgi:hypothetical protein